uniref:putative CENPB DNA-binding domain-containing protein 1 n=1 Tax=Myxine glutinosa TaxID=7769 RepID=UPI00358F5B9A
MAKVPRRSISMELKLKVLRRMESGVGATAVGREFGLRESSVRTIVKNEEKVKASSETTTPVSARKLMRSRSSVMEKMERLLSSWIEDMNRRMIPLSQAIIMAKALSLYDELKEQEGEGSVKETFTASRGWFDRFKRRSNLHNIRISSEALSGDEQAAAEAEFPSKFKALAEHGNYPAQVLFNVEETGLFWKRIPSRTFICKEERHRHAAGFKVEKVKEQELQGREVGTAVEEAPGERILTTEVLHEVMEHFNVGLDLLRQHDDDWERSSTVRRMVLHDISCYQEILRERKNGGQLTIDDFLKRSSQEARPGPSRRDKAPDDPPPAASRRH